MKLEATADDAPPQFHADEAAAWACGYDAGVIAAIAEAERLRRAIAEIIVRTMPYQDSHDSWPLVAGVHRIAHEALAESR